MGRFLVMLIFGVGVASAQAQDSCQTASDFKGATDADALALLASLKGTIAMSGNNSCSGALVTFKGRSSSTPALVLSAGHCSDRGKLQIPLGEKSIAAFDAGEVFYRIEYRRGLTLETGNSEAPRSCVDADQIIYGTLTGADILLLRLVETYEQIERRTGVKPFVVSQERSFPEGFALRMPSARWQNDRACQVEATVEKVKEHRWVWSPVMRLKRLNPDSCLTPGGVSGAPGIQKDTNEVIGVLGTSNDGNATACELNNPCEISAGGAVKSAAKDTSYVHFVHQFYSCLDATGNVDLDVPGCLLAKPQR
jgi:hypothetical protein